MKLKCLPIFKDNYIWILYNNLHQCIIVDPGQSDIVINTIKKYKLHPVAILLTHHHFDHVNGVKKILKQYSSIKIYGPKSTKIYGTNNIIYTNTVIYILNTKFRILLTPGHTTDDISYFGGSYLFCGDTIFSGGCGKIIEGNIENMYLSIQKILSLPNNTKICCSHEYTLKNLQFCNFILPQDIKIKKYYEYVKKIRKKNKITLPTTLRKEKEINIFLKIHEKEIFDVINKKMFLKNSLELFYWLRKQKDNF